MQFSWTKVKDALLNLTTSNKLSEAEASAIQAAIESDAASVAAEGAATPVVQAPAVVPAAASAEVPAAPAPVAQVTTQPPVPAPAPVAAAPTTPAATEPDELAKLRAENARLKAQITPALAAAVPSEDATQTGKGQTAEDAPNAYYADLKRIKEKYNRFGLSGYIKLGNDSE